MYTDYVNNNNVRKLYVISDFDSNKDQIYFETSSNNVSVDGDTITVNNTQGEYLITLTNNNSIDLTSEAFNFI